MVVLTPRADVMGEEPCVWLSVPSKRLSRGSARSQVLFVLIRSSYRSCFVVGQGGEPAAVARAPEPG
jgi:hypothetical protein